MIGREEIFFCIADVYDCVDGLFVANVYDCVDCLLVVDVYDCVDCLLWMSMNVLVVFLL